MTATSTMTGTSKSKVTTQRSLALDIFRGMTICFMIIVNNSDDLAFAPLHHAHWFGFTPTDLVFPSFLFAVGNAMSFSMKKFETMSQGAVLRKILRRTLLIFLLGYLMYWFPFFQQDASGHWGLIPIANTRIMGVLQRIALAYGIASLLIYYLKRKTVWAVSILLLVGYWIILLIAGVPGADPLSMTGNAGYRLDMFILGPNHMYHGEGIAFDPEGLLSTLPSVVNVVVGYYAGVYIGKKGKEYEGLTNLLLWGCGFVVLALAWNMVLPIGKKLWTSSFVCVTVGIDLCLLAFLIYIIEFRNKRRWTPFFNVFGKNALFIYLLSELLITVLNMIPAGGPGENVVDWINRVFYHAVFPGAFGSLLFAISYMMVCWCVGKWLDYKKIYIRV
ncbi:MAG TPA: heparan-alpha-glucosaminide N-acetyltransferase domain-containing protein [Puia sp.]|nr:heparan-alpha-glucosaminide N-acetyltransferase domain-containing protein [Puia sp.]